MKKILIAMICLGVIRVFATGVETNATYVKIIQASNDVQSVIHVLPDVEKLWPKEPKAYFESANQAAHVFGGAMTNVETKQALVNLFTNMIQKPLPQDNRDALECIELKRNAVGYFLNFEEISNDKSHWIEIANFIGEVRARIIPNYQNQTVMNSVPSNTTPEQEQRDEKEYQQNLTMDALQERLRSVDFSLTWAMRGQSAALSFGNPTNAAFIKQITSAAHLTKEETERLRGIDER